MMKALLAISCLIFATAQGRNLHRSNLDFVEDTERVISEWENRAVALGRAAEHMPDDSPRQRHVAHELEAISASLKELRALISEIESEPDSAHRRVKTEVSRYLSDLERSQGRLYAE